jgi:hypothetical protein
MKKFFIIFILFPALPVLAQDFAKDMAKAKAAYTAGNLEETHFSLQQAMQEVDVIIGKEVLKLLPQKMDTMSVNGKDDNVSSNIGYVGATIHRSYGRTSRKADLSIISNSPLVAMINTVLNTPMMAGMNDGRSKTVKIQGYKARMEKQDGEGEGITDYEIQVPLGSALITFKVDNCTDSQILAMAETIPLEAIAKLIQ